jgi:hypothetical protein
MMLKNSKKKPFLCAFSVSIFPTSEIWPKETMLRVYIKSVLNSLTREHVKLEKNLLIP